MKFKVKTTKWWSWKARKHAKIIEKILNWQWGRKDFRQLYDEILEGESDDTS